MLLIGRYDSPYVRRVGIALTHYQIPFRHQPYSVFRDAEKIAPFNPLRKAPTLVDDDGVALCETFVCLDVIDERVHALSPSTRLLLPRIGPLRREGLRIAALCSGVCEKALSLIIDREVRKQSNLAWSERCQLQVRETLAMLEAACAARLGDFLLDTELSHADIAATVTLSFVQDSQACDLSGLALPALSELNARCEALPEFQAIRAPFDIPQ